MLVAITRPISPRFNDCELTHLGRVEIDMESAQRQHAAYVIALESLGARVVRLAEEPDMPDSVFVEDAAVVVDELALITRPGAASRRLETRAVEAALGRYRDIARIEAPGTIDGGDVLTLGREVYVGASTRTNEDGVDQMRAALAPHGYGVHSVPIRGCLHLKSAVTQVSEGALLINPEWVDRKHFAGWEFVEVAPEEPSAANALFLPRGTIYPSHFPATRKRLESAGVPLCLVDASEVAKAEGAVTCCSIVFEVRQEPAPTWRRLGRRVNSDERVVD